MRSNGQGAAAQQVRQTEGQPASLSAEETLSQVRELLFGDEVRRTRQTFADQKAAFEAAIAQTTATMREQIAQLTQRIVDLENATERRRRDTITDIGAALAELGQKVKGMSAGDAGR